MIIMGLMILVEVIINTKFGDGFINYLESKACM